MKRMLLLLGILMTALPLFCPGQERKVTQGRIPIQVIGDRLLVRCRVSSDTISLPVHLFVSYDRLCGLELHNQAASALKVESPDGSTNPMILDLAGFEIEVERREHGDEEALDLFTRAWSEELDDVAVVGTIGAKILSQYFVTFDLPHGQMVIAPPRSEDPEQPGGPEALYVHAHATTELVWLPVELRGSYRRMLALGSERYDSVVDVDLCEEFEAWDGNIGSVEVDGLNLSQYIPWRPEEYTLVHVDGALGTLGINFLELFRVSIDRVNGWVGLTQVKERPFPQEERAFFGARASEESEAVARWLRGNLKSRLAAEAADLLLLMRVDDGESLEAVTEALEWVDKTRHRKLKATQFLEVMRILMNSASWDAAIVAGRMGVKGGRSDRYPESVHRLHALLGQILLDRHRDREAWEHLMSAAFGLNEAVGEADQARVNLLLGQYYERAGRFKRAMSRYVQAVITPEAGPQAIAALMNLQQKMGGEPFSVDLVDRLISGKVRSMTAPTRFEEDENTLTRRCVLLEHVTNPHLGRKAKGLWRPFTEGGTMVFEALRSHFPTDRLVALTYHIPMPKPVATMNSVSMRVGRWYGGNPVFALDGQPVARGALEYYQADEAYRALKGAVRRRLAQDTPFDIQIQASIKDGLIKGDVTILGPKTEGLRVEILLAEKGVLYPGLGATVVHRMLVRGSLTPSPEGFVYRGSSVGIMQASFSRSLADIVSENKAFLEDYERRNRADCTRLSVTPDSRNLLVVAVLRRRDNHRVLQAVEIDLHEADK